MQAQMIDTGEVRLHVVTAGAGPPVVLLHGFPSYWQGWRHQIEPLAAAGFRVIVPDLRGYNLSEKPSAVGAYTLDRVAGDILGLLKALGYDRASIVGHDWGAAVAWTLAISYPDAVERLVAMNVTHPSITRRKLYTPQRMWKWWYMFFFQLPWLPEWIVRHPKLFPIVLKKMAARKDCFTDDEVRAHLEAIRQPGAATAALNYYRAGARFGTGRGRGFVQAPTLLLWSELDPILGDDLLEGIEQVGADVKVHRVPGAGHWLQNEMPDEINRLLLGFLAPQRV